MQAHLVGHASTFRRHQLSVGLLFIVGVSACGLLKKKGDTGPDAQASAAPVIASIAPLVAVPTVAPVVSAVPIPSVISAATHTHTHTATSTAKTTPSASPGSSALPGPTPIPAPPPTEPATATATATATVAPTAPGIVNPQCLSACQKGYQDCIHQSGNLTGLELIKQCRNVLMPCISACQ